MSELRKNNEEVTNLYKQVQKAQIYTGVPYLIGVINVKHMPNILESTLEARVNHEKWHQ